MNQSIPDFIVIDDDRTNNMICKMIIQNLIQGTTVQTFTDPAAGVAYINSIFSTPEANDTIVFLDINMPVLNGWDVLNEIESSVLPVKQRLTIYMLSSSVSPDDKAKAAGNKLVSGYIEKPLSRAQMQKVFPNIVNTTSA